MPIASTQLLEVFQQYRDRPFVFLESGGNAGDHLIWKGADKLASVAGLNVRRLGFDAFMQATFADDEVIYIHGGGGYNPWWSGKPMTALEKVMASHKGVVIQGPQSVHPDEGFLRERVVDRIQNPTVEKLYFFCRERYSHRAMQNVLPDWVELRLDHDTAFNLDSEDLVERDETAGYTLYVIRRDKEAPGEADLDLTAPWMDPAIDTPKYKDWLRVHARAARIVTNRLHSSIAGMILGKPTTLIANSYFKNRAVWEFSLKDRGVAWQDEIPAVSSAGRIVNRIQPLRRVLGSRTGQRFMRRVRGIV